jgi:type III secretion system YscQ/HrcQ family protein
VSEAVATGVGSRSLASPGELTGAALAARVLGSVPRRIELAVGGFGQVTLTWGGHGATSALRAEPTAFVLVRGRETGRLALDAALAGRVVAVALGADARLGASLGRSGPGARGVVAGFLAGVLHAAGAPVTVSLAPASPDDARGPGLVGVTIGVAAAGGTGWAVLEAPRAWLEDAVRLPADARELAATAVEFAVELARTMLSAGELAAVAPGDAVVFDGAAAVAPGAPWGVRIAAGEYEGDATVAPDGALTLAGGFARAASRVAAEGAAVRSGRGDTTVLTSLPVEIVAELARVKLRGDEVVALGPGAVVPLGGVRRGPVVLRVAGQPWAEGELADVDGELAVRLTRLLR